MEPQEVLCCVVTKEIANKLIAHKEKEREHVEALLASQKHLTSNVRTLINSLDQVVSLSAPKFSSNQPDVLRSMASRAKALQKQLDSVSVRMQRIQVHLQSQEIGHFASGHQQTEQQQQQQQQQLQQQEQQQQEQQQKQQLQHQHHLQHLTQSGAEAAQKPQQQLQHQLQQQQPQQQQPQQQQQQRPP